MDEKIITGAIVSIILGSYKLIEILIKKIQNGNVNNKKSVTITEQEKTEFREYLKSLYDWHDKTDNDGRRMWYVPKSYFDKQDKILNMIENIEREVKKCSN